MHCCNINKSRRGGVGSPGIASDSEQIRVSKHLALDGIRDHVTGMAFGGVNV